jgi:hypothetical protein
MSPRRPVRLDPVTLLLRLRSELASANLMLAIYRLADVYRKYNPDQPRVPAGQPGGGQWTSGSGSGGGGGAEPSRTTADESGEQPWSEVANSYGEDGSLASQTVVNRDGSTITSDFVPTDDYDERHTVQLPGGEAFSFENDGATQTIRDAETGQILSKTTWGPDGPEAEPIIEPAFAPAVPFATKLFVEVGVPAAIVAAKTLYDWYSGPADGGYDDGKRAVASFRAYDFDTADNARIAPDYVGRVDKKDVDDACPRHGEVQDRTDAAYDRAMQGITYPRPQERGTAIHKQLKDDIDALDDPNLRAEVSIRESQDGKNKEGSIRTDVLERVGNGTVCVYDLKTGDEGLTRARSIQIARHVYKYYRDTTRILLIQIRPRR